MNFSQLDNGDLRFTEANGAVTTISIYEPDLVRVRYWPTGSPDPNLRRTWSIVNVQGMCAVEGHDRNNLDALQRFSRPTFVVQQTDTLVTVSLGALNLQIAMEPRFTITWLMNDVPFAVDHPLLGYQYDSKHNQITHTLQRTLDEHYYGFGEKSGALDKHARHLRMRNADAFGYDAESGDPLYKHVPFYITLRDIPATTERKTMAFGLFYDTTYDCEFDMGAEVDNYYSEYRYFRTDGSDLDYYLMAGATIERVVEQYTALTGRIPMPPRWTLGYLGSAMRYTDAPNAQEMLAAFIAKCRQYDIPCSGFHLSSGYSMSNEGKRYVFVWNRDRVPDPVQMSKTFHDAGISLAANIKPGMLTTHPYYKDAESAGLFIHAAEADSPDLAPFWGGYGAHLDFTNPATIAWWKQNVKSSLLENGIDSTWNDNNEFNLRDDAARCNGFGQETPIAALRPVHTMLMVMASDAAQKEYAPEKRAWLLTRAGMAGIQRYAATWTGDNRCSWKTLRYNIPMGLGLSLSGMANVGHDVGGFAGDPPSPELLVRWVQNGIFHPRFCIHSWRTDDQENAPWMHPEVLPLIRDALNFRYQLIPYLYSLLWESSQTGHPVIRPTVYHFQDDPLCQTQSFEFLVGSALLVATVLEPNATTREIYLPSGTGWYDWYTGGYYAGGQRITLASPLDHTPLLAREGSLIPLEIDGKRSIWVFPHRSEGTATFNLYEDDGVSNAYQQGTYTLIPLQMETTATEIKLQSPSDIEIDWVLPSTETRRVVMV